MTFIEFVDKHYVSLWILTVILASLAMATRVGQSAVKEDTKK